MLNDADRNLVLEDKKTTSELFHFNIALLLPVSIINFAVLTTWYFTDTLTPNSCTQDGKPQTQKENLIQAALILLSSVYATVSWFLTLKILTSGLPEKNQNNSTIFNKFTFNRLLSAANLMGCFAYLGFAIDRMVRERRGDFNFCTQVNTPASLVGVIFLWGLNATMGIWGWARYQSTANFFARTSLLTQTPVQSRESYPLSIRTNP